MIEDIKIILENGVPKGIQIIYAAGTWVTLILTSELSDKLTCVTGLRYANGKPILTREGWPK